MWTSDKRRIHAFLLEYWTVEPAPIDSGGSAAVDRNVVLDGVCCEALDKRQFEIMSARLEDSPLHRNEAQKLSSMYHIFLGTRAVLTSKGPFGRVL